jgi:uncharacterized protein YacL
MLLQILRALFVLLMAGVGWFFFVSSSHLFPDATWPLSIALVVAVFFICIDILAPRKKLAVFSGTFLGLIVGLVIAYALSFAVTLVVDQYLTTGAASDPAILRKFNAQREDLIRFINMITVIVCCYLSISFILQTKDDFRFIIPYVEFSKQIRGARPMLVDTSIIIDGRILDIASTGILESRLIVPRFVLNELQLVADSADKLKRNRGRRGLDILNKLQTDRRVEVIIYDWSGHSSPEAEGADQKLLVLAKELNARVLTNDVNLSKVAQVRGVDVININDLASALRPVVLPGEKMQVRLLKPGEEPLQGIGFLDDGTMVVVEGGRSHLNEDVEFIVTNMLQTATGRMIFGRLGESSLPKRRPDRAPAIERPQPS